MEEWMKFNFGSMNGKIMENATYQYILKILKVHILDIFLIQTQTQRSWQIRQSYRYISRVQLIK